MLMLTDSLFPNQFSCPKSGVGRTCGEDFYDERLCCMDHKVLQYPWLCMISFGLDLLN